MRYFFSSIKSGETVLIRALALFAVVLIFPMPTGLSDFFHQKSFLIFILCIFAVVLFKGRRVQMPIYVLLYAACPLIYVITSITSNYFYITNISDVLTELFRYVFSPIIFLGLFLILKKDVNNLGAVELCKKLVYFFLLTQLIICFSLLLIPDLRNLISLMFNTNKMMNAGYLMGLRMTGSFENPNYLGFVAVFTAATYRVIGSNSDKVALRILIYMSLLILVFLSGSRTALLAIITLYCLSSRMGIVLVLMATPILLPVIDSSRYAVILSGDLLTDESFATRFRIVLDGINLFSQRPLLGYSANPLLISDNTFITVIVRYGAFFLPMLFALKIILYYGFLGNRLMFFKVVFSLIIFNMPLPFFLWTGEFLDNFRLFLIYSMFELLVLFYLKNKFEARKFEK